MTAEAELISDVVVIGGGAAGMTAGRKTVVERSSAADSPHTILPTRRPSSVDSSILRGASACPTT